MYKKLLYGIAAITALFHSIGAEAQDSSKYIGCGIRTELLQSMGLNGPRGGASAYFTAPDSFPTSAIQTCGKFKIYYEDLRTGAPLAGFNDPVSGVTRRNTFCSVLTYIQSVFDFSKIPSGSYIRLHVDTSWSNPGHPIPVVPGLTHWYSSIGDCAPYYNRTTATAGAIVNGFVYDYIKSSTGTDPNPSDYHANLQMNFASIYKGVNDLKRGIGELSISAISHYSDTGTTEPCAYDLYSNLLHLVSHSLGWFSWQDTGAVHGVSTTTLPRTYYDTSLCIIGHPKVTSNPFGSISKLLPLTATWTTAKVWLLNNKKPPYNRFLANWHIHPFTLAGFRSEFSHLWNCEFDLQKISPGDFYNPVMGIPIMEGVMSRKYTKAELIHFRDVIGLDLTTSFSSSFSTLLNNKLSWSSKMMSDAYNFNYTERDFAEKVNPDFTVTNNVGSSVVINLNSDTSLHDDDGDTLSVMSGTLVNFRGCGDGGNNHARLTLSSGNRTITYTPRPNFYGRAQFGFNLWDGKEKGAFVIYTIEVKAGNNVGVPMGNNIIVNGNFEEGAEVKLKTTDETINNSYSLGFQLRENRLFGGRLNVGTILSDGHPYDAYSNYIFGTAIRNSFAECSDAALGKPFGNLANTFPWDSTWLTLASAGILKGQYSSWISDGYPDAKVMTGSNNRYQPLGKEGVLFNLTDTMKNCRRYILEFDTRRTYNNILTGYTEPSTYPTTEKVKLGFTNSDLITDLTTTPTIRDIEFTLGSIDTKKWQHFKYSFTYCADTPANVLHFAIAGALSNYEHIANTLLDNVSVVEVPLAISIKIIDTPAKGCNRTIYAGPPSLSCPTTTYEWKDATGAIVGTSRALDISIIDTTFYVVTVSDGCNTAKDTITIFPCECSPVKVLGKPYTTLVSGSVPTTLTAGKYYVPTSIVLSGSTDFNNVIMLMEPDVQITVPNSNKLTIDNSHLFTCPDTTKLWKGIKLDNGSASTGRIEVKNNTLIEDAEIAINAINPNYPTSDKIIDIDNAVFNRNIIGINIEDFTLTRDSIYPFSVVNTVFTTRQFNKAGSGYPNIWTAAKPLKVYTPNGTLAPYFLDVNYPKVRTKNDKPIGAGIKLRNIGNVVGSTYYEISIGGGGKDSTDANLFDNTSTGIYAENTNLSCYNSIFINMQPLTAPIGSTPSFSYRGCGIYANTLGTSPSRIRASNDPKANGNSLNKFFDCGTGIQSIGYYETFFQFNRISSSNTATTGYAGTGIYSTTASPCKSFKVDYNSISNVSYGVNMNASSTSLTENSSISNNELLAINPWLPTGVSGTGQYLHQGILFDGASASGASPVMIQSNTIEEAYNGIEATNVKGHKLRVEFNGINKMRELASSKAQYGIVLRNTYGALVSLNNIGMTSLASSNKIRAVYAAFNTHLQVCANTSTNMDRAFDFAQVRAQVGTRWVMNTMNNSNKGFVLGSDIGAQGYTYKTFLVPPYYYDGIGNQWIGFGGAKYETYVEKGLRSDKSILHVRTTVSSENPTNHIGFPPYYPFLYEFSKSIIEKPGLTNCDSLILPIRYWPVSSGGVKPIKSLGMMVVSDSLGYDDKLSQWMAQLSVYESGLQDPIQIDSFPIFDRFMQHAATSRYKWIADVQAALHNMDTNLAATLLNTIPQATGRQVIDSDVIITDYNEADTLIDNYISYYYSNLKYLKKQTLDTNGLANLASKCPAKDGAAVYLARSLYALVTGVATSYDDDSCMDDSGGLYRIVQNPSITTYAENQNYTLYPNPNNGTFIIKQSIADNKSVNLKVYNALGALVYKGNASFVNGQMSVKLGQKAQGVYLVCIGDHKERTSCLRFIIN